MRIFAVDKANKAQIISTIVDEVNCWVVEFDGQKGTDNFYYCRFAGRNHPRGAKKAQIISTIVDQAESSIDEGAKKAQIISTIVDAVDASDAPTPKRHR